MRVDDRAESGSASRAVVPRVIGGLLLGGAAALVVLSVYSLTTMCWEGRWYSGCRNSGAGDAVGLFLLAQLSGVIGFAILRRTSRRRNFAGDRFGAGSRLVTPSRFWFWLAIVLAVVLVASGVVSFLVGLVETVSICFLGMYCEFRYVVLSVSYLALGEGLGFVGFMVARRAFRRRPWRHDAQRE
ncbi:MAG TPA: hypothetical protein ENG98_02525 [Actinobacteria bacterium]|nr:hypothetical protein BMS3Bbin02_01057 [bacterium BMS3Bbin02]HDL41873.1 hypothetical protein [Actinomycetota bacterium]